MFILCLPLDNKASPGAIVSAKAAHTLRWLLHPLDWAAFFLTPPGLACDFPGALSGCMAGQGLG